MRSCTARCAMMDRMSWSMRCVDEPLAFVTMFVIALRLTDGKIHAPPQIASHGRNIRNRKASREEAEATTRRRERARVCAEDARRAEAQRPCLSVLEFCCDVDCG